VIVSAESSVRPRGIPRRLARMTFLVSCSCHFCCCGLTFGMGLHRLHPTKQLNDLTDLQIALQHPLPLVAEFDMNRNAPAAAVPVLR
jgi:hypothetical protein